MRRIGFTAYDRVLKNTETAALKPDETAPLPEVEEAVLPSEVDETVPPNPGADKKKPKGKSGKPKTAEAKAEVIENAGDGGTVPEAQPGSGSEVGDGA